MLIAQGDFTLGVFQTPDARKGWARVIVEHVPTRYRKLDCALPVKTHAEYEELLADTLRSIVEADPANNTTLWPDSVRRQSPQMIDQEIAVCEAAKEALRLG